MQDVTYPAGMSPKLVDELRRAASLLRKAGSVRIVTHIDADGISAGSIAALAVQRLGIPHTLVFEKKITDPVIEGINSCPEDVVWICDLGSAYMSQFTRNGIVVTDHHVPDGKWRSGQSFLDSFRASYQMNPHLYGLNGSYEVCGAGMTYLLAKEIDPRNIDLAYLAVVGAVGDFQDTRESRLVSWNRMILEDAVSNGDVSVEKGIRYFGRESRPIAQFLEHGEDPRAEGLSDDRDGCLALLEGYGIEQFAEDGTRRTWADLDASERAVLTDAVSERIPDEADRARLVGEVYTVNRYELHSGLHDVKEFSTVLNSCGRYDDAETGARLCMGDLSALKDAERNRRDHRKNISVALQMVKDNHLIRRRKYLQYFDAGTDIRETVVGIVAGMVLSSDEADPYLPIIAFAAADDGIKVSARASRPLISKGLDLSQIMKDAAEAVGGLGGGHSVAAGATIPEGAQERFLDEVEKLVSRQISS